MYRGNNGGGGNIVLKDEKKKFYSQLLDPVGRWTGNAFSFKDGLRGLQKLRERGGGGSWGS